MTRRTVVLFATILLLLLGSVVRSMPVSASHPHDVAPQDVDPRLFALPVDTLPPPADACIIGTQDASGALTAAHVTPKGVQSENAIICGYISDYKPATASAAGTIGIGGQGFTIAAGVTIGGIDPFTIIDHIGVSDDQDADGVTTPPDGHKAQIHIVHSTTYENLGRLNNGWREDMHYTLSGVPAGSEYLVSVFPDAAHAQAAMDDATTKPFNILSIIAKPLPAPDQCTSGTKCEAYTGIVPGSSPALQAIFTLFVRGPVLVETATQVPADQFTKVQPNVEASLYAMLISADNRIQLAFNPKPPDTDTPTATATSTSGTADTATPTPTDTPTDTPTTKPKHTKKALKCKKGYKKVKVKGKRVCKKIKKKK